MLTKQIVLYGGIIEEEDATSHTATLTISSSSESPVILEAKASTGTRYRITVDDTDFKAGMKTLLS